MSYDNSNIKIVYVLLDGVGDLPHPDTNNKTPLDNAETPNLDLLTKNGKMGQVISVGKGIAPESDIAVFNMLGYKFHHADYAGRGVIEAIGIGIDFKNGDLALRGNFATLDEKNVIIDRRAGRNIEKQDATGIAKEIEENIKFSNPLVSVVVAPTIGHRVVIRIRDEHPLSANISNTDPAYARIDGMGIAKAVGDFLKIERCLPLDETDSSLLTSNLVNEFTEQISHLQEEIAEIKILQNKTIENNTINNADKIISKLRKIEKSSEKDKNMSEPINS